MSKPEKNSQAVKSPVVFIPIAALAIWAFLGGAVATIVWAESDRDERRESVGEAHEQKQTDNAANNVVNSAVDVQSAIPDILIGLLSGDSTDIETDLAIVNENWQPSMSAMLIESMMFARNAALQNALLDVLEQNTGESFGRNTQDWYQWLWAKDEERHTHYARFKSSLYAYLDPRFAAYFNNEFDTRIRLDEVRWGGVAQDGIPPLRNPAMIAAADASYLDDDDVVFGVEINGDARAYPQRILAWHEMFVDDIGGTNYAGVYCTLCGAVILYETQHDEVQHALGTSGFLYRSNKLMYDKDTQSLWNTTWGEPVIGQLVGNDIRLARSYVVTSTWGEWRRRHPQSSVLSLQTGHQRDYGEGVAYQDYFATDKLMFDVPIKDARLKNKDEILALQFPAVTEERLAISADYLKTHPVYQHQLGSQQFVVLTDGSGANRVYETQGVVFDKYDGDVTVVDDEGNAWTLTEAQLLKADSSDTLKRLPAHRAFWFGWVAAWKDTQLVM